MKKIGYLSKYYDNYKSKVTTTNIYGAQWLSGNFTSAVHTWNIMQMSKGLVINQVDGE